MKVAQTSCTRLEPIDKEGLEELVKAGKANPNAIKTLKCKTVAEGKFRHLNYIRNLPAYVVDEPPTLLGDDTAPNPSETLLAALGSCLAVGIHANAVANEIVISKLELELEADINITSVWGVGDLSEDKPLGFTDVRLKVILESNVSKARENELIAHARKYSPVANTIARAVNLSVN
ncbi:OsmC family protein [Helicobacter typhlonius]|uniref:OsmC family protein n=1 Tax=Helicobacter typhlonius TaxID=76936 RepID=UPI002FE0E932